MTSERKGMSAAFEPALGRGKSVGRRRRCQSSRRKNELL